MKYPFPINLFDNGQIMAEVYEPKKDLIKWFDDLTDINTVKITVSRLFEDVGYADHLLCYVRGIGSITERSQDVQLIDLFVDKYELTHRIYEINIPDKDIGLLFKLTWL